MTIPRTNELVETPFLTLESALEVKKIAKSYIQNNIHRFKFSNTYLYCLTVQLCKLTDDWVMITLK